MCAGCSPTLFGFAWSASINRLDRRDFNAAKGEGGCGEVRFIYRLAYSFDYKERTLASRMPFDFNAVFTAGARCRRRMHRRGRALDAAT